jgi:hypothetical protein
VGDGAADIVAPLFFLALVLASWALRPASRKLGTPKTDVSSQAPDRRPIATLLGQPSL